MGHSKKQKPQVSWTEREDALICRLRSKGCELDEIAAQLPRHTTIAVKRRFAHLINVGRIVSLRAAWTPAEDALICELRAKGTSAEAIAVHLSPRTVAAISQRIQQLRLDGRVRPLRAPPAKRRPWTDREESVLIQMRRNGANLDEIARKLRNRTRGSITAHVQELLEADELERTAHSPLSRRLWSPEEDELVAAMRRAGKTLPEMAEALDRSLASVNSRVALRVRKGELKLVRPNLRSPRAY